MLKELVDIEVQQGEKAVDAVIRAANFLIRRQFCVAETRGAARHYDVLTRGRYQLYFERLFDALGYRFTGNRTEGWVGIIPDTTDIGWNKLKLDETIVLLVMAVRWQEGIEDGEQEDGAVIRSTFNELHDAFDEIINKGRKVEIPLVRFKEIVNDFIRRGLAGRGEVEAEEFEVIIRPLINAVVGEDAIGQLARFEEEETARLIALERASAMTFDRDDPETEDLDGDAEPKAEKD